MYKKILLDISRKPNIFTTEFKKSKKFTDVIDILVDAYNVDLDADYNEDLLKIPIAVLKKIDIQNIGFKKINTKINYDYKIKLGKIFLDLYTKKFNDSENSDYRLFGRGVRNPVLLKEWALDTQERLKISFGTPNLRGPVEAYSISPKGVVRNEYHMSSEKQTSLSTNESYGNKMTDVISTNLQRFNKMLGTTYDVNDSSADIISGNIRSSMNETRRSVIHSIIQEMNNSHGSSTLDKTSINTSHASITESPGIDLKLSATHHKFKVVVPIEITTEIHNVCLTWCPTIRNPFMYIRGKLTDVYNKAYSEYITQHYVPRLKKPYINFIKNDISVSEYICAVDNDDNDDDDDNDDLYTTNHTLKIKYDAASVAYSDTMNIAHTFEQRTETFRDDSDIFTWNFSATDDDNGEIKIHAEVINRDPSSTIEGTLKCTVSIFSYSQDSITAMENHDTDLANRDFEILSRMSQARQYASMKQRKFIENYERLGIIQKTVFDELIRSISMTTFNNTAIYKEKIRNCIDWSRAKVNFKFANMSALYRPELPPDHFLNSTKVTLFLPILQKSEKIFGDTYNLLTLTSMPNNTVLEYIRVRRTELRENPDLLDKIKSEMIIGDHIESVMSNHDHAT